MPSPWIQTIAGCLRDRSSPFGTNMYAGTSPPSGAAVFDELRFHESRDIDARRHRVRQTFRLLGSDAVIRDEQFRRRLRIRVLIDDADCPSGDHSAAMFVPRPEVTSTMAGLRGRPDRHDREMSRRPACPEGYGRRRCDLPSPDHDGLRTSYSPRVICTGSPPFVDTRYR